MPEKIKTARREVRGGHCNVRVFSTDSSHFIHYINIYIIYIPSNGVTSDCWVKFGHFCITFIALLIRRKNIWNTLFWLYLYFEEIFVTLPSTKKSILRWIPFQKYLFIVFWNTYFNCAEKYYFILKTQDSLLKSGYPRWSPMPHCY